MTNKYFLIRKLHIMLSSKIKIGEVLPSATAGAAPLAHHQSLILINSNTTILNCYF